MWLPPLHFAHGHTGNISHVLSLNIGHTPWRKKNIGFPEPNSRTDYQNNIARCKGEAIHAKGHFSTKLNQMKIMPKSRIEGFYYRNHG